MAAEALRGDLGHFFPAELLQLLQLAQATGRLELERSGERAEVYVERGRPVWARTTGACVRAGQILVHRGAASASAVEGALSRQREQPGRRLGTLLVAANETSPEQVRSAVQEGLRRMLYGLLLWRDGGFRFVPGEHAEHEDVKLELDLDRLILDGLRQADEARGG
jgi:uncharacterized protein DUF4388